MQRHRWRTVRKNTSLAVFSAFTVTKPNQTDRRVLLSSISPSLGRSPSLPGSGGLGVTVASCVYSCYWWKTTGF